MHVQMDDANVIKYLQGNLQNMDLAMKVMTRACVCVCVCVCVCIHM